MMLRFTGRGSGFSDKHTNAFFTCGDSLVMIDCAMSGFSYIRSMDLTGINRIDVLVTHTHGDHISGIGMLCAWGRFQSGIHVTVVAPTDEVRDDLLFYLTRLEGIEADWFRITTASEYKAPWIKAVIPTRHTPALEGRCFGYCLDIDGQNVVYTGDTATLSPYTEYLSSGTILYTEACSRPSSVHMYIDDIIRFADRLTGDGDTDVRIFLMHMDDEEKIAAKIKETKLKPAPLADNYSEDNKEAYMENTNDLLEHIFDITDNLYKNTCSNLEDDHSQIFGYLTELGKMIVGAERASFWKWDKRKHQLWTTAATGVEKIVIPDNTGLVGKAIANKSILVTNNPYEDPDFNQEVDKKTGFVTKSVLVLPVADVNGEFIGAFQLINKLDGDGFDEQRDSRRLSLPALICGLALESDTFLEDAHHDRLTKLKNRIGFYNDFSRKYMKYLEENTEMPLSMFICDIDKFKLVNDTYGHNAGDQVLEHAASILQASCRENDNVYRWGGEEFIMLMPDTTLDEAVAHAEEIRLRIEAADFPADGITIRKTMSFGVHQFVPGLSIEDNVSHADQHLYTAKETGRNRVIY